MNPASAPELLGPERRLHVERLARHFDWRATGRSPLPGRHRGPRLGTSGEFEGYRPYEPGDDLARLDLRVLARLGQRVVRLEREDSALPLTVLIDRSSSMTGAVRARAVAELAYFFLVLAADGHDPTRLFTFGAGRLTLHERRRAGCVDARALLRALHDTPLSGASHFEGEFARLGPDAAGPGLVIIISDGLGLVEPARAIAPLRRAGRVLWLAPLEPDERSPRPAGDVRLEPREPGNAWRGRLDAPTVLDYRRQLERYLGAVRSAVLELGGDFVALRAEEPIGDMIAEIQRHGRVYR
ncbi:MAG: DUF58 domain-containing protein [Planctomycetota bacterium]